MKVEPRRGRLPISLAIATTFAALVAILLGSVLATSYFSSLKNTQRLLAELAVQSSSFIADEVQDHLTPVVDQSDWAASVLASGSAGAGDAEQLDDFLLGALAATPQVTMIAFVAVDTAVVRAFRGDKAGTWSISREPPTDLGFVNRTLQSGRTAESGFWNEVLYSETTQRSYINYVHPVRRDGRFIGVVLTAVSLNELSDIVSRVSDRRRGTVFILTDKDQVLAHPNLTSNHPELSKDNPTVDIGRVGDPILAQFWAPEARPLVTDVKLGRLVLRQIEAFDRNYLLSHSEVQGLGEDAWIVGQHLDTRASEAVLKRLRDAALVGTVILGLGVGLAIVVGRMIARPIKAASAGVARIAELEVSEVRELPRSPFVELDAQAQSFNAMLRALRWFETYVPRSLVRRLIRRGDTDIESEGRDLTILFTDLVGFTSKAESLTASETAAFLNHHFALLGKCVEDEVGTIDKFIGDSLMAFWGAPDAQPDQVDRAVRAACAMARMVEQENLSRRVQGTDPVRLRIGLHTGPAVVGNIGAPDRMNYTVVGDTVNIANRLEGLGKLVAPDDEVVILASASVARARSIDIAQQSVGSFDLKGKNKPVEVFRILTGTTLHV